MQVTCTTCQARFETQQLALDHPPVCPACAARGTPQTLSVNITERVQFDDRPDDAPIKEREIRE
jgi:NAD-dependent SIR2 family protein deacetylase